MLVSSVPFGGSPAANNRIRRNWAFSNAPDDIVWDGDGAGQSVLPTTGATRRSPTACVTNAGYAVCSASGLRCECGAISRPQSASSIRPGSVGLEEVAKHRGQALWILQVREVRGAGKQLEPAAGNRLVRAAPMRDRDRVVAPSPDDQGRDAGRGDTGGRGR